MTEEEEVEDTDEPDFSISEETNEEDEAYKGPVLPPYNPRLDLENYKFPSLDLLNEYEDDGPNIDMEEQNANKDRIIKVLRSFGIEISSIKASVGSYHHIIRNHSGRRSSYLENQKLGG